MMHEVPTWKLTTWSNKFRQLSTEYAGPQCAIDCQCSQRCLSGESLQLQVLLAQRSRSLVTVPAWVAVDGHRLSLGSAVTARQYELRWQLQVPAALLLRVQTAASSGQAKPSRRVPLGVHSRVDVKMLSGVSTKNLNGPEPEQLVWAELHIRMVEEPEMLHEWIATWQLESLHDCLLLRRCGLALAL